MATLHHALLLGTFLCVLMIACCLVEVEGSYRSWNRKDGDKKACNTATKTTSHSNGEHNFNHGKHNYNNGRYSNVKPRKSNFDVTTHVQRKMPKKNNYKKKSILNKIRSSKMSFTRISKSHSKRLQYELVLMAATKKKLECKIRTLKRKLLECEKNEMNQNAIANLQIEKDEMRSQLSRALNRLFYLEQECGRVKHKMDLDILVLEAQINSLLSNNTALESELEILKANCSQDLITPQKELSVATDPKEQEDFCNATCPCKENEYFKNAKMECFADVESCGLTWDLENIRDKYYYISKAEKTWHQAREYCRSCNLELAVFENRADELDIMDVMFDKMSLDMSSSQFWIGFSDLSVNGIFSNNYRKPDYSNWAPGLPRNAGTEENCVYVRHLLSVNPLQDDLKWYHDNCNRKKQFICQLSKHCTLYFDELRGNPVRDYSNIIPDFITDEEEKNQNKLNKFKAEASTDSTPVFTTQENYVTETTTIQEDYFTVTPDKTETNTSVVDFTRSPDQTESTTATSDITLPHILLETTTPNMVDVTIPHVLPPEMNLLGDQDVNTYPPGPLETTPFPNYTPEITNAKAEDINMFHNPPLETATLGGQDYNTYPPVQVDIFPNNAPEMTTTVNVGDFILPHVQTEPITSVPEQYLTERPPPQGTTEYLQNDFPFPSNTPEMTVTNDYTFP